MLEAEQTIVAARAAVRDRLADSNSAALARLDEAEGVFATVCRANRSFSADTLVMRADGSQLAIVDVEAGDVVLAWDLETGVPVAREVTATLPHTDWLLDAHFSDGSVLEVTEDHRFWSTTDTAWVELQDLDTSDVLLTPDGVTVTVDFLDWDAGVTTELRASLRGPALVVGLVLQADIEDLVPGCVRDERADAAKIFR